MQLVVFVVHHSVKYLILLIRVLCGINDQQHLVVQFRTNIYEIEKKKMNTFPLEQKVCMITGGLGGFALSISELMLKRGARIWLCDLKQEDEGMLTLQNDFPEALEKKNIGYCHCDVTSENDFDAAFLKCKEIMGEIPDVLINAAGIMGEEQWDSLYDINLVRKQKIF